MFVHSQNLPARGRPRFASADDRHARYSQGWECAGVTSQDTPSQHNSKPQYLFSLSPHPIPGSNGSSPLTRIPADLARGLTLVFAARYPQKLEQRLHGCYQEKHLVMAFRPRSACAGKPTAGQLLVGVYCLRRSRCAGGIEVKSWAGLSNGGPMRISYRVGRDCLGPSAGRTAVARAQELSQFYFR